MRSAVADASRLLASRGLVVGTAGNVSARVGDLVAITPTGADLSTLVADEVCLVDLDGHQVAGDLAPTSELGLHLGVYVDAPSAAGVVHTHAPASTAAACVVDRLPVLHYNQLALGGELRVAPFHPFGTPALAAAVREALDGRLAALMANHGAIAVGPSLAKAVEHALLTEWLADLHARAVALGTPRPLTPAQQEAVIEVALRTGYGTTHRVGAPR
ncbi:class II aldolase/adducin family protein [Nocardioides sp. GY 10127]|nr:class II aldolase/adducin family protein [Nocardioides sp. GY 10127]